MAAAFTRALGQEVRYNAVSPDVYGGLGRDGVSLAIRPSTHAQARVRACAGADHFRSPAAAYGRLLLNERGAGVQALLDHKSIATTAHYTRVDSQRLRLLVGNPGCPPKVLFFPMSQARPERVHSHWQLALVGPLLRILNGAVSLFDDPGRKPSVGHLFERTEPRDRNSGLATARLELLACITFR